MSQAYCPTNPPSVGYPPTRYTEIDKVNLAKLRELKAAAPYGYLESGKPRSEIMYLEAVGKRKKALVVVDFRWPFFLGLGLGGAAVIVLGLKSR